MFLKANGPSPHGKTCFYMYKCTTGYALNLSYYKEAMIIHSHFLSQGHN